jgi:Skp family chaperone for outer membrane proteins
MSTVDPTDPTGPACPTDPLDLLGGPADAARPADPGHEQLLDTASAAARASTSSRPDVAEDHRPAQSLAVRIAEQARIGVPAVEDVFATYGLPLVLTPSRPRGLRIVRLRVAGTRSGAVAPGPFDREFPFDVGLTALVASNLRGKTSVLEFITWVLRGTPANLQPGPRAWMRQLDLDAVVAGQPLGFRLDLADGAITAATVLTAPGVADLKGVRGPVTSPPVTVVLRATDDASYAASTAALMMDRLDLSPIVNTYKQTGTQTHGWPMYFGAVYLGASNTKVLLGEHATGGQPSRLLQVFLDLPASAASTRVKTAHDVLRNQRSMREAEQQRATQARAEERAALEDELAAHRARLAELSPTATSDSLPDLARRAADLARLVADARRVQEDLTEEVRRARTARQRAVKYVTDLRESGVARALFHGLDPTSCPRCDQAITVIRRRQEHDGHACAVCTREVPADDPSPDDVVAEAETLHEAAEEGERTAQAEFDHAARELRRLREELDDVDAQLRAAQGVASLPDVLETQARIWQLEGALSVLPAPAPPTANGGDGDGSDLELRTLRVLAAAQKVLEKDNRAAAAALFDELDDEIAMLGRRFGIAGLEWVSIDRGARLRVVQDGGAEQWFSACAGGVQVRLRIAVVIALLRVGAKHGVATHPGLVMIDSPKREELQDLDATPMFRELAAVAAENEIQLLTTTRDYALVHELLDGAHIIEAPEGEPLW